MPGESVLSALRHIWQTLEPLGAPVALMGGLALAAWKYVRATRDVDLLVGIESRDLELLLQRLRAAAIRPKRTPPAVTLGKLELIQLLYEPPEAFVGLQVDLLVATTDYPLEAFPGERHLPRHGQ